MRWLLIGWVALATAGCTSSRERSGDGSDGSVFRFDSGPGTIDGGSGRTDSGRVDTGVPPRSDGGGATTCTEVPGNCPSEAPDREQMCGACCWRVSNADRLDRPELRVAGMKITTPTSLASAVVRGLLTAGLDEERFNWILRATVSGSELTMEMGHGERHGDGTFSFVSGVAPAPGDASRWDPVSTTGTAEGDFLAADVVSERVTLALLAEDGSVSLELPLHDLEVHLMTTHGRTCVGERRASSYETGPGRFGGFITVEDAKSHRVVVGSTLDTTLCMFVAGMATEAGACDDTPQTDWPVPPNSLCDGSGCGLGGCDASTCNAWQILSELAAHGVEIRE